MLLKKATDRDVLLSQAQAEAIGRLQLIQLVGLEIEKLVNEYREVADEMRIPIGTVMSRLFRGRRRLAESVADEMLPAPAQAA